MKHHFLIFSTFLVCLFSSCSKPSTSTPNTGGSGTGGTDTTGTGGGGTTPPASNYVVKTIGIGRMRVVLDDVTNKLVIAEFIGGGNRIIVKAGNDYKMEFSNPSGYEPTVLTAGGGVPDANYPVVNAAINNGTSLDTTKITLKLKGFDRTKTGYDQLNLVLCKEVGTGAYKQEYYNLTLLRYNTGTTGYNNAFYQKALTTGISVADVEVAPAVSASSYIVRDAVIASAYAVTSTIDSTIRFEASTSFWTDAMFNLNPAGAINVGSPIKIELVNADKGTATPNGSADGENALYFSNIKKGVVGTVTIPEPADTVGKVFIRLSGFNPSITGYNQLRLILADDGVLGAGQIGLLQANPVPKKLTLALLQKCFPITNFTCILLMTL